MKKFVKMSLIAAIAVAGTTASAQPLAEAIKNVDVSGTMVYRYDDAKDKVLSSTGADQDKTTNGYKIATTLKSKVNDDVTANVRILAGSGNNASDVASLNTSSDGDANLTVQITNANFAYTGIANTTVIVGKQGLTTPWTVATDSFGNEQTGTGILALSTLGPVTLAGAYFNQTNLGDSGDVTTLNGNSAGQFGGRDIYTAGIMAKVGPVSLSAWYLDMDESFDTYTLDANASFDLDAVTLGADVRYTSLDLDKSDTDNNLLQTTLTAKMGIFNAKLAYAATDKQGGTVALDSDAATSISAWGVNANTLIDADYYNVVFGAQVLPSLHVSANYAQAKYKATSTATEKTKYDETYAQLTYQMSKNFMGYIRYGVAEKKAGSVKSQDLGNRGRLYVKYSF
ncbi:major outer membrane protein [Arcobacter nitrofigilis DSM 7299]|uniref:Major outer membrane protein n=1 Tax=Arcobacter nitrofigilis (strain ATCC 33309 / DSM 7299 / CCUG 15893 / LMG 7604 / NCTC 12251 / CI) TaxID=572480 RepID=D5V5U8_ARCNC|nr:major outer membrane protein [Arcobacter nitrofigilis]ADG92134.1 major outer membrane protein [Arcobacter nitrofigilis DSM 7299]